MIARSCHIVGPVLFVIEYDDSVEQLVPKTVVASGHMGSIGGSLRKFVIKVENQNVDAGSGKTGRSDGNCVLETTWGSFFIHEGRREAWLSTDGTDGAFEYLLSLIISYVLLKSGAAVIHGTGVISDGACDVFSGASGQGKTTLAAKFPTWRIVDDETLILYVGDRGYRVSTPPEWMKKTALFGEGKREMPLGLFFLLKRRGEISVAESFGRLYPVTALVENLRFVLPERFFLEAALEFATAFTSSHHVMEFSFGLSDDARTIDGVLNDAKSKIEDK